MTSEPIVVRVPNGAVMRTKQTVELPEPVLTVRGDVGDGLLELVTGNLAVVARHAHEPVLAIRVALHRHHDPRLPCR